MIEKRLEPCRNLLGIFAESLAGISDNREEAIRDDKEGEERGEERSTPSRGMTRHSKEADVSKASGNTSTTGEGRRADNRANVLMTRGDGQRREVKAIRGDEEKGEGGATK